MRPRGQTPDGEQVLGTDPAIAWSVRVAAVGYHRPPPPRGVRQRSLSSTAICACG
jgi:hypothetical protein